MAEAGGKTSKPMKVAAVQFEPALFRKEENAAALLRLAAEAADGGAGLVVLPEMGTTGYVFRSREEIAPYVEPVPGPTTRIFGRLARERSAALVVGLPEVDPATGAFYNTAVLLGPDGEVGGVYRKTHSFYCDTLWAAEGNLGLPVFEGPWPGPLGLLICMDAGFFETARVQALAGARVIAFPTNWLRTAPSPEWRARAAENGVYLVAADRWGEERGTRFAGGSCVIGPNGEVLAQRDRGDGVVAAEIDLAGAGLGAGAEADRAFVPRWVTRRPALYHALLRHPYLWPGEFNFGKLGTGRFWLGAAEGVDWAGGNTLDRYLDALPRDNGVRLVTLPPVAGEPARLLDALLRAATRRQAYLVAAVGRREAGEELVFAGPEGPLGRYRSPHLGAAIDAGEPGAPTVRPESAAGPAHALASAFPTFDLPFGRVGLLHPLDLLLPEPARILAKEGADVILASGSWPAELDPLAFLWAERAETNYVWLAVATDGAAGVFAEGPRWEPRGTQGVGEKAAGVGPPGVAGETGPEALSRRKERLRRLRPELYLPLAGPGPNRGTAGATS